MGLAEHADVLLRYNSWANRCLLTSAQRLDDGNLAADHGGGSIQSKLEHIVNSQMVWLRRWSSVAAPEPDFGTREGLAAAVGASSAALEEFGRSLQDADWTRPVDYTDSRGVERQAPLGHLITHVVNHGTMHRAEAGLLLAAHGASPGDLDFVFWSLEGEPA